MSQYDATVTSPAISAQGIGDYDHVDSLGEVPTAASGNDCQTTVSTAAAKGKKRDTEIMKIITIKYESVLFLKDLWKARYDAHRKSGARTLRYFE